VAITESRVREETISDSPSEIREEAVPACVMSRSSELPPIQNFKSSRNQNIEDELLDLNRTTT
jgi:hypothetical protein